MDGSNNDDDDELLEVNQDEDETHNKHPPKPPPNPDSKYYKQLSAWKQELEKKLKRSLAPFFQHDVATLEAFSASCRAAQSVNTTLQDAQTLLHELEKNKDHQQADDEVIEKAKQAVADAETSYKDALDACQSLATSVFLDTPTLAPLFQDDLFDDADLVTYVVLCHGTVAGLAQWCDEHSGEDGGADDLLHALQHDTDLMRLFVQSGGARQGQYGAAVQIYRKLLPSIPCSSKRSNKKKDNKNHAAVLKRLALAVALELAEPYPYFDPTAHSPPVTDPMQRYVHYEQAYLLGELDDCFACFNVWEMRHVVNSDATNEELGWGRQTLWNYRPDIGLLTDKWRYCYLVRTDVRYTHPDFYKGHKSYDQVLSGGGECGPRAWYGRFICKAFGIPTWGVRQPGHAAMTRWTHDEGWVTCLGAGFEYSWWENQGGLDFLLETQARSACGSERNYMIKVLRLQWISQYWLQENQGIVQREGVPDPASPWCSLAMMQRRRLSSQNSNTCRTSNGGAVTKLDDKSSNNNTIDKLSADIQQTSQGADAVSYNFRTGEIVIPASCCSSPTKTTEKVMFLPCVSGELEQQLYVEQDAEIEFTLSLPPTAASSDCLDGPTYKEYKLSCCVCTVHRTEQPLRLIVESSSHGETEHVVKMPYTVGMWRFTVPVVVKIAGTGSTKLRFNRPQQEGSKGFSWIDIRLVPV